MTSIVECLAADWDAATLIGRIELPEGPTPVRVREGRVQDISGFAPTCADALARADDLAAFEGRDLGALADMEFATVWGGPSPDAVKLLSPVDLQCVKASGVTFAVSAVERVIEERARGAPPPPTKSARP